MTELQHINVKIYAENVSKLDLTELNPVFQSWIRNKPTPDVLIDVADYLHVPAGPGMVLVGLESDYSFDNTDRRWGLRYNRKKPLEGSDQDRLHQATRSALEACQRLENDDRLKGKIKFRTDEFEFFINDRALAPNTEATLQNSRTEWEKFFKKFFGGAPFSMERDPRPRARFGLKVKPQTSHSLAELLQNLT